jgi:hypothetical protein
MLQDVHSRVAEQKARILEYEGVRCSRWLTERFCFPSGTGWDVAQRAIEAAGDVEERSR